MAIGLDNVATLPEIARHAVVELPEVAGVDALREVEDRARGAAVGKVAQNDGE